LSGSSRWLSEFVDGSFERIDGWVDRGAIDFLRAIGEIQDGWSVEGGVAEIGIFRGKFFIALNGLVADPAFRSIAIDLFEGQDLNIDASGSGDIDTFRANLRLYDRHRGENVVVMSADSTQLRPSDILDELNTRPRVFSIDGGHTPEHTISDLSLAAEVIGGRGIVILDDILNAHWIGVIEGTVRYLDRRPTLWPLAIGHNKLLLSPMSVHAAYLDALGRKLEFRKTVRLCGYDTLAV
jgi:hypothetical protein